MIDLAYEQKRLYCRLCERGERGFVRICSQRDALWVSDMPRRTPDALALRKELSANDIRCREDVQSGLWYLDWTEEKWQALLVENNRPMPPFPTEERLHPAYALCRMLLLHNGTLSAMGLEWIRTLLKKHDRGEKEWLSSVQALHEEAALLLRKNMPLPRCTGEWMADWLEKEENQ